MSSVINAQYYTDSLFDCRNILNHFNATEGPNDEPLWNGQKYQLVQCDVGLGGVCPDGTIQTAGKICQWVRYLKLKCDKEPNAHTRIHVTTNSMPTHCYNALGGGDSYPAGSADFNEIIKYQWTVDFNMYPLLMSSAEGTFNVNNFNHTILNSQRALDNMLCTEDSLDHLLIDENSRYTEKLIRKVDGVEREVSPWDDDTSVLGSVVKLPNSDMVAGIAVNGVFLFKGTHYYNIDGFFPKNWTGQLTLQYHQNDVCMGTSKQYNVYRYHMHSPCIYPGSPLAQKILPCLDEYAANCSSNPTDYVFKYTPMEQYGIRPIGIARDGRPIYGPYKQDGSLWQPCEVDICNGRYVMRNYYAYQLTMFFPYTIGCWGPGYAANSRIVSCSTNPRICIQKLGSSAIQQISANILIAVVLGVFATFY
eukprot:403355911